MSRDGRTASGDTLRARIRQFAERRLPALTRLKAPEALPIVLDRRRVYIVPTAFGLGFAVLLAVMLVGALNYANNAALLLTCLLAGTTASSMLAAFRTLDGLRLDTVRAGTAVAGTPIRVLLDFAVPARLRHAIRLDAHGETLHFDVAAGAGATLELRLPTTQRGWLPLPRLRVYSTWPFGLFRAWSWMRPQHKVLVYPCPESHGPRPAGEDESSPQRRPREGDELAALRDYRVGDPMKLVAWKASARHHGLLVRDFEHPATQHEWMLEWQAVPGDHEMRIARLARWVGEAHAAGARWTLALPQRTLGPAAGSEHYHRCMTALALLP
jgi:uncharacterized protein (DUF58 family)